MLAALLFLVAHPLAQHPYITPKHALTSVAFSYEGRRMVVGANDGTWKTWDGAALGLTGSVTTSITCVAFRPHAHDVAVCTADEIIVFGSPIHFIAPYTTDHKDVKCVAFSPDGMLLAGGTAGASYIVMFQTRGTKPSVVIHHPSNAVESLAFSPDGKYLLDAGRGITLIPLSTLPLRQPPHAPIELPKKFTTFGGYWVKQAVFSPDGNYIASAGQIGQHEGTPSGAALWSKAGKLTRVFTRGPAEVTCVAYSPDGKQIAAGALDSTVRVWQASTGKLLYTLKCEGPVHSIAYSPIGYKLAAVGDDRYVWLWNSQNGTLIKRFQ